MKGLAKIIGLISIKGYRHTSFFAFLFIDCLIFYVNTGGENKELDKKKG